MDEHHRVAIVLQDGPPRGEGLFDDLAPLGLAFVQMIPPAATEQHRAESAERTRSLRGAERKARAKSRDDFANADDARLPRLRVG